MSMEFTKLIDKEEIILDSNRLVEWERNDGKAELMAKIDRIMWDFLHENNTHLDNDKIAWIRNFTEEIKSKL